MIQLHEALLRQLRIQKLRITTTEHDDHEGPELVDPSVYSAQDEAHDLEVSYEDNQAKHEELLIKVQQYERFLRSIEASPSDREPSVKELRLHLRPKDASHSPGRRHLPARNR